MAILKDKIDQGKLRRRTKLALAELDAVLTELVKEHQVVIVPRRLGRKGTAQR